MEENAQRIREAESQMDEGTYGEDTDGLTPSSDSAFPGQENEARVQANISAIRKAIEAAKLSGTNVLELVQRDESLEGKKIYIGGNLVTAENYAVGTPNLAKLAMKPADFQNPDGTEYLVGITTEYSVKYQIVAKIGNGTTIGGNYAPVRSRDPAGLVYGPDGKPYANRVVR